MRKQNIIECSICQQKFSSAYVGQHLKEKHKISSDIYAKLYGEYRVNKLNALKVLNKSTIKLKCILCNSDESFTDRSLSFHLRTKHNVNKNEYIIKHILSNSIPLCGCGCGSEVKILNYGGEIHRKYISGHNSSGKLNPMYGRKQLDVSRKVMSEKASFRILKSRESGIILPWHNSSSLKKRGERYSKNLMDKKCKFHDIEMLSLYEEQQKNVYRYKCNKCSKNYTQYHNSYFICRDCFPRIRSKYELEILDFLEKELKIEDIVRNYRKLFSGTMELDFFLPKFNIGIEFNGLYWHSEVSGKKDKNYHINKTTKSKDSGVRLIHIFEDDWITKTDIIKSKLKHILKKNNGNKYFARKCEINPIDFKTKQKFLSDNHIQGNDVSSINLGCFVGDTLISVMTFSKLNITKGHRSSSVGEFELSRFCSLKDSICIGTFSKMLKFFINKHNPNKILTYADRCWSDDSNVYTQNGFSLIGPTQPNYWYSDDYKNRLHRFNFTKHKLVKMGHDSNLTEWEIMQSLRYDRIWDCGHLKYEWKQN